MRKTTVTRGLLERKLLELGLGTGDWVMVHISLSSMGYVEPAEGGTGADTVVDALLETVGETGLLMMPTFTHRRFPFHPLRARSASGAITEALRLRPGSFRSRHPTHAICAMGREAERVVRGHERTTAFGADSPLGRLALRGGAILLLGVGHNANSAVHVAEELFPVPYEEEVDAPVEDDRGTVRLVRVSRAPGHSAGFVKLEPLLRKEALIRDATIGTARAQLMKGPDLVRVVHAQLKKNPGYFLCDDPACRSCAQARKMIRDSSARGEH